VEFDFNQDLHGPIALDTENHDPLLKERGSGWPYRRDGQNGGKIIGIAVKADNLKTYLPIGHSEGNLDPVKVKSWLNHQLTRDDKQPKIFANSLYDVGWFKAEGIKMTGPLHDIMFMAPLIDENRMNYSLDRLGKDYLDIGKDEAGLVEEAKRLGIKNTKKDNVKGHLMRIHPDIVGVYAEQDVEVTMAMWKFFMPIIEEQQLQEVYQLEMDLVPMLIDMRMRGVRVDVATAELEQRRLVQQESEARAHIKDVTGLTIGSWDNAAELARVFDKLEIKYGITEKSGQPSITQGWLKELNHPVANSVLRGRKVSNMRSTFLENAILNLQEGGRVYPNFNPLRKDDDQANGVMGKEVKSGTKGTVSGRFSSSDPNFQQIPSPEKDPDLGHLVRKLFLPEEGELWHGLDYSAQEPRGIVHFAELTKCPGAREIAERYREDPDTDFHMENAQLIMAAKPDFAESVAKARKPVKIIGLGLAYGMGGGKLAKTLGMDYTMASFQKGDKVFEYMRAGPEAQEVLHTFDRAAPYIKALALKCQKAVREKGYIRTPTGRRFRFPKDDNGQYMFLNKALNRLIQGTSADMTKVSLRAMYREGILPHGTVHDENDLSSGCPKTVKLAKEIMETCFPFTVPIRVDVGTGANWGDASDPKQGGINYKNFIGEPV
jgi:DNA polymerase I-like protein with 3'-5' exonuclease and polymerase domains